MTYSSCLSHPPKSRYIQLHEWQKEFCQGNLCAALLLSHFSCWHDWKIRHDQYYRRYNDIAEMHGDARSGNEDAYLYFTMEGFLKALMGLFGKKSISEGLELLASMGVIRIHKNPNRRYLFDKTKYFKFYPEVCNQWLQNYTPSQEIDENDTQVVDNFDNAKMANRLSQNGQPSRENRQPPRKNGQPITDTTNNTTNKKTNNNTTTEIFDDHSKNQNLKPEINPETKSIVDELMKKGFKAKDFHIDVLQEIEQLQHAGATLAIFLEAHSKASRVTQGRKFNLKYLIRVVEDLLAESNYKNHSSGQKTSTHHEKQYQNEFNNAMHWMSDITQGATP